MTPDEWRRVKAIAGEAWARPAAERVPYISSACAGDEGLDREVLSLVASMEAAEDCFEVSPELPADDIVVHASLAGRRVGAYEMLSPVGAGGMGEVYKARDTRLNRIVAIKVLPARAIEDPVSDDRMKREARAIAALNHPHICTLHDIGSQNGLDFLVMEYVDGETLAVRLSRGRLPITEALQYAAQIASALIEAHRAGIVHRDVKPANVMLERAGLHSAGVPQAKLLDFGIAKANTLEIPGGGTWPEPGALDLTVSGFVLGTAHYMAPEQIVRSAADVRTDIFAFGAVLFEMLTGRKAFEGKNRPEVLAAICENDVPRVSSLRPGVPAALDRIVMRSLAKNPGERYQSIDDLLIDLRAVQRRLDSSRARMLVVGSAIPTLAIGATIAWVLGAGRDVGSTVPPSVTRLARSAGVLGAAALSPDGSNLVYSWNGDTFNNPELVLLRIGSTTRVRLTNDPGNEEWPVWSPDGSRIAFVRCATDGCGIFMLPVGGGPEQKLRDLRYDRYYCLAWSPDSRSIVYADRTSSSEPYALFILSLDGLVSRRLTTPRPGNLGELRFAFSPDGTMLAVIRLEETIGVHLVSVETGADTAILSGQREWFGSVAWSPDGRHVILSADQQGVRRLWRLPVTGGALEQLAIAGEDSYFPSVSSRAGRLAFVRQFHDWDFSRISVDHGQVRTSAPFPSSTRLDLDPAFSPDGRKLAFVSERGGTREVWVSNADGSEAIQLTSLGGPAAGRPSWSPDGRFLAFQGRGIYVMPAVGGPLRKVSNDGEMPSWSVDGRWIYFMRGFHVWKVPAAGGAAVQAIASEAYAAHEAPQGGDLYFAAVKGIWRRPVAGGEETPVVRDFESPLPGYWTVLRDGIYYVARESLPDHTVVNHLKFFDFARHRSVDLGTLTGTIDDWVGGLTVSPDRRTVLYSHRTYQSSEVMLVEHFR
jgi:eukaryotic-like serine/threonine-protein kinase